MSRLRVRIASLLALVLLFGFLALANFASEETLRRLTAGFVRSTPSELAVPYLAKGGGA